MNVRDIRLRLDQRTTSGLVDYALSHAKAINDHPELFPAPEPTIPEYDELVRTLNAATVAHLNAQMRTKQRRTEKLAARRAVENALRIRAGYVSKVAGANKGLIHAGGFEVRKEAEPSQVPDPPAELRTLATDIRGAALLKWKRMRHAKCYLVEMCLDPLSEDGFKQLAAVPPTRFLVRGLVPGQQYWFRVATIGAAGQSEWCDPIMRVVT